MLRVSNQPLSITLLVAMALHVMRAMVRSRLNVDRRPGSPWWRKMKCCGHCPIYDRQRRACGHLNDILGCQCFMPLKNGLPEATCWLWVKTEGAHGHNFQAMEIKKKAVATMDGLAVTLQSDGPSVAGQ